MSESDTPLEFLIKQFTDQTDRVKNCMVDQALTHEEYLRLRGMVQGFAYAIDTIKTLAKKLEEADE